ncbi:MAG: HlyD family secretion protein, partial [Bacteroidia bacterium]
MKRVNLLYLAIIPIAFVLFQMTIKLGQASALFYGFAENKETELSHYKSVLIEQILVTPGEFVKKGQLLMVVEQANLDFKIDDAGLELEKLAAEAKRDRQELQNQIAQLKAKRSAKQANITAEITALEARIASQKALLSELKSIKPASQSQSANDLKLEALKVELAQVVHPIDVELAQLEKMLNSIVLPSQAQQNKVQGEIQYYQSEQAKLNILAPSDGLIGNIRCKEGEYISAFTKLINFYEPKPTLVKGFVHESLIPQIQA